MNPRVCEDTKRDRISMFLITEKALFLELLVH